MQLIDDPKQAMRYETAARLSAFWFVNNQCTEHRPWSGIHDSADNGRYIYEYYVVDGWCRGMGVWGQANGIMACLACAAAVPGPSIETMGVANHCVLSAVRAANYMMSLQTLDSRKAFAFGAFREHAPTTNFSFPRDAATGAFGLLAMYRLTGWQEYLDRAVLFADWYRKYGSDESGWPHVTFYFDTGKTADESAKGIWQAGGALTYHYLYELTGDRKWLEPLRVIVDRAVEMLDKGDTESSGAASHHGMRGNDDFCSMVLLAAWLHFKDRKYLARFARNITMLIERQHPDGSYHGMAGEYMTGLEMLDAWQVRDQLKGLVDETKLRTALLNAADFGLAQQELAVHNVRMYGGMYGQNWYGVARDRIHQRSTGYGSTLYSRLVAKGPLPYWSALAWKDPVEKIDINRYLAMDTERVY